jgi:hypothetical protein
MSIRHATVLSPRIPVRLLLFVLFAALALAGTLFAGCGQGTDAATTVPTAAPTTAQGAPTTSQGAATTAQGVATTAETAGQSSFTLADGVSIPDGFPIALLPDGAHVVVAVSAGGSTEGGTLVGFESTTSAKKMYDWFLDALPKAGYDVAKKAFMDGGDQGGAVAIQAGGSAGKVLVTGGGKSGEIYSYVITLQ